MVDFLMFFLDGAGQERNVNVFVEILRRVNALGCSSSM